MFIGFILLRSLFHRFSLWKDGTTILCHFGVRCSGPLGLGACECLEGDQKHLRGHSPRRTADGDSPWVSAGTSEASEASNDGRQLAGPNSTGSKTKSRRSELLGKYLGESRRKAQQFTMAEAMAFFPFYKLYGCIGLRPALVEKAEVVWLLLFFGVSLARGPNDVRFRVRCHCGVVCQWGVHNYGRIKVCNGPLFCRSCFPSSPAYGSVGGVR